MGPVGSHRVVDQPAADEIEGFAFPGLVLAAVLNQLRGAEAKPQGSEATPSVDRRQLPVITDQHHLGPRPLGVLEETAQLARADHAGFIHYQHGAGVELVAAAVKVAQQPVAGGHVLKPLPLQAHRGDPGRRRGQEPVAIQLPSMAGNTQGEGLARPSPADDQGDPLAALAHVPDHRPLVLAGGGMRLESGPHRIMGHYRGLLISASRSGDDQPLFNAEELGGGPPVLLQRPIGDHGHGPLSTKPVHESFKLGPADAD